MQRVWPGPPEDPQQSKATSDAELQAMEREVAMGARPPLAGSQTQARAKAEAESQWEGELASIAAQINSELDLSLQFDENGNIASSSAGMHPAHVGGGHGGGDEGGNARFTNDAARRRRQKPGVPKAQLREIRGQFEGLIDSVKAFKQKSVELREQLTKVEKENKGLRSEVSQLREEQEELEEALRMNVNAAQYRGRGADAGGGGASGGAGGNAEDAHRRKREEARRALFSASNNEEEDDDEGLDLADEAQGRFSYLINLVRSFLQRSTPLGHDVRTIQSRYGASTAAFFKFYQWIISTFVVLVAFSTVVSIIHMVNMVHAYGKSWDELFARRGLLFQFMVISSFEAPEAAMYSGLVVLCVALLLFLALRKWITEHRQGVAMESLEAEQEGIKFAKEFLASWDHSITDGEEAKNLKLTVAQRMAVMLEEERVGQEVQSRTRWEITVLWSRRIVANLVYLALQSLAWAAIIFLITQSAEMEKSLQGVSFLSTFASSIVPAAVTVINAVVPQAIIMLTDFEEWDSGALYTNVLITRMFFLNILNAAIQIVAYLLLADKNAFPGMDPAVRDSLTQQEDESFICPLDQISSAIFQLILTEFVTAKVIALAMPYVKWFWARYIRRRAYVKDEFSTAESMVSLFYTMALVFAAIPIAPLSLLIIQVVFILDFKFEKAYLFKYLSKPNKPWKAHKAGLVFVKFYLATFFMMCVPTAYLILSSSSLKNSNKQCWFGDESTAYDPLETALKESRATSLLYNLLFNTPWAAWTLVVTWYMRNNFGRNHVAVMETVDDERERRWAATTAALEAKVRKQNRQIHKLQLTATAATAATAGGGGVDEHGVL